MSITFQFQKQLGDFQMDIAFAGKSDRIGILGASGSGKSMTLKAIAGIETPDFGRIQVGNQVLYDSNAKINLRPQERNVGYLFQNYALFPTMTVIQNVEAGIKAPKAEKHQRALEMMERFRIAELADRLPGQLSGGQQQRVALARIMASEPEVILLDEPFSALDVSLKDQMQREMEVMLESYQGTVIIVSHSRDEIYRFSEELLIIDEGKSIIFGDTKTLFQEPKYLEAARLTGCKNFSKVKRLDAHRIEALDWGIVLKLEQTIFDDVEYVGYRAHDFQPVWGGRQGNSLRVAVDHESRLPFERNYYIKPECGEGEPICWFLQREQLEELDRRGLPDYLKLREEDVMLLRKR